MMIGGMTKTLLSLSLGYVLCVLAKKQDGLLKTVGYTIGISIMVLGLLYGLLGAEMKYSDMKKGYWKCGCLQKGAKCMMVKPGHMQHR